MKISLLMISFVMFVAFALPAAISAQKTCSGPNGLTPAEIGDILTAHNKARAVNKLDELKWDCNLAEMAQEWATRGKFEHRTAPKYGECLFVSSRSTAKATAAVDQWMLEKVSWDAKTATCDVSKVCTHYTQVVWKKTKKIGCGINRSAPGKWKVLVVCNYDPAGNNGGPPF